MVWLPFLVILGSFTLTVPLLPLVTLTEAIFLLPSWIVTVPVG